MPISTDSYVSLEEADSYLAERMGGGDWPNFDETDRISALVTASRLLGALNWKGVVENAGQTLKFPRRGLYRNRDTRQLEEFPPGIPTVIKEATIELALHLIRNPNVQDQVPAIPNLKLNGVFEMSAARPVAVIPARVLAMVENMVGVPGNHWFPPDLEDVYM